MDNLFTTKDTVKKFFKELFCKVNVKASIVIYNKDDNRSYWIDSDKNEEAADLAARLSEQGKTVYYNVALQSRSLALHAYEKRLKDEGKLPADGSPIEYTGRGFAESAYVLVTIAADIDIKDKNAHKAEELPESREVALEFVRNLLIQPTVIVNSGHGLHLYWYLAEPIVMDDNIKRQNVKKVYEKFREYLIKKGKERGWKVDPLNILSTPLRPPGTVNLKDPQEPVTVEILEEYDERLYTLADFEEVSKEPLIPGQSGAVSNRKLPVKKVSNARLVFDKCQFLQYCLVHAAELTEPWWHIMIGILTFCEGGIELIHDASAPYPGYSPSQTDDYISRAQNFGKPQTCEHVNGVTGGEFCKECPYLQKVKTPVSIGYADAVIEDKDNFIAIAEEAVAKVAGGNVGAHLEPQSVAAFYKLREEYKPDFLNYRKKIKDLGAMVGILDEAIDDYKKGQQSAEKAEKQEQVQQKSRRLEDCPLQNYRLPSDYDIAEYGVIKQSVNDDGEVHETCICNKPMVIVGRSIDIDSKVELLELAWKDENWHKEVVERDVAMNTRKLIDLSLRGCPVHSMNCGEVVLFVADFETENKDLLPKSLITSRLGWQKYKGDRAYLAGGKLLTSGSSGLKGLSFKASSDGDRQVYESIHQEGSLEGWVRTVSPIKDYPVLKAVLYSGCLSVLQEPLGASNFGIELFRRSSEGKTTGARAATSEWGGPDEKVDGSFMNTWDTTRVGAERGFAIRNGMPTVFDDTKRAKNPLIIAEVIYLMASGRGRMRANPQSLAPTKSFTSVLISTGEVPATSFTKTAVQRAVCWKSV